MGEGEERSASRTRGEGCVHCHGGLFCVLMCFAESGSRSAFCADRDPLLSPLSLVSLSASVSLLTARATTGKRDKGSDITGH
eukprot:915959-Rhodomonas_salina.1